MRPGFRDHPDMHSKLNSAYNLKRREFNSVLSKASENDEKFKIFMKMLETKLREKYYQYLKARVDGDIENPLRSSEISKNIPVKRSKSRIRQFENTTTTDDLYDADDSSDGDSRPNIKGFRRIGGLRNGSYRMYKKRKRRKLDSEFGGSIKKANKMLKKEPKTPTATEPLVKETPKGEITDSLPEKQKYAWLRTKRPKTEYPLCCPNCDETFPSRALCNLHICLENQEPEAYIRKSNRVLNLKGKNWRSRESSRHVLRRLNVKMELEDCDWGPTRGKMILRSKKKSIDKSTRNLKLSRKSNLRKRTKKTDYKIEKDSSSSVVQSNSDSAGSPTSASDSDDGSDNGSDEESDEGSDDGRTPTFTLISE